jgi:hypothetical protein
MSLSRISTLAALAMISTIAVVSPAHAQNTVGTITQIAGSASIQRAGTTIAAATNMPVMLHDKIITQKDASLTIGMVDDSSIQLSPSTTITIDESYLANGVGAPRRVGLFGGTLHAAINGAMRGSNTTAFEVHTPNAIGAVRGTEFTITYEDTSPKPSP